MGLVVGAFLSGIGLLLAAAIFQVRRERDRAAAFQGLELAPNCLLTRHPLVFLSGGRSVFKIFDHWNRIPRFLREHGYEVLILEPPAGFGVNVEASLIRALDDLPEAGHLIADTSLESALETIARWKHPKIVSLTLVKNLQNQQNPDTARGAPAGRRVDAAALRPPAHAIETFEVPCKRTLSHSPNALAGRVLLVLHNLLSRARRQNPIDPAETGELATRHSWEPELPFLRLAVALAERDLQADRPSSPGRHSDATWGA